jgi:hypothetical protein
VIRHKKAGSAIRRYAGALEPAVGVDRPGCAGPAGHRPGSLGPSLGAPAHGQGRRRPGGRRAHRPGPGARARRLDAGVRVRARRRERGRAAQLGHAVERQTGGRGAARGGRRRPHPGARPSGIGSAAGSAQRARAAGSRRRGCRAGRAATCCSPPRPPADRPHRAAAGRPAGPGTPARRSAPAWGTEGGVGRLAGTPVSFFWRADGKGRRR